MPPKRVQKRKRKTQRGKGNSYVKCDKFYRDNGYIPEKCQWWDPSMGDGGWGKLRESQQSGAGAHYFIPFIVK